MRKNISYFIIAWILIVIGIVSILYFLHDLYISGWTIFGDAKIQLSESADFATFVGGFVGTIFSLAGFLLVIASIRSQKDAFLKERFESRLFELIRFHRENVSTLEFMDKKQDYLFKGKQVFKVIYDQFDSVYFEFEKFVVKNGLKAKKPEEIFISNYLSFLRNNSRLPKRDDNSLIEIVKINICYLVVFFGLSQEGLKKIRFLLNGKILADYYDPILAYLQLKPVKHSKYFDEWQRSSENYEKMNEIHFLISYSEKRYYKFYGGHQFRLGQYFRHLFQAISYVDQNKILSQTEKNEYVKLFRAQLSDYELIVFFINSLSLLGSDWEIGINDKSLKAPISLITRYELIKNISDQVLASSIYCKSFYPNISFDII